jgi:hypothetical protein
MPGAYQLSDGTRTENAAPRRPHAAEVSCGVNRDDDLPNRGRFAPKVDAKFPLSSRAGVRARPTIADWHSAWSLQLSVFVPRQQTRPCARCGHRSPCVLRLAQMICCT